MLESSGSTELFQTEEERVGVPVKGGLYEVDFPALSFTLWIDFVNSLELSVPDAFCQD